MCSYSKDQGRIGAKSSEPDYNVHELSESEDCVHSLSPKGKKESLTYRKCIIKLN